MFVGAVLKALFLTVHMPQTVQDKQADDWVLNANQMVFMLQHHNVTEAAYRNEDTAALRALAATDEFKAAFGAMSFDEACDRYESMIEDGRADA